MERELSEEADVNSSREWHLDKRIPITLIGAILLQTFTFGWWASSISGRVEVLERGGAANSAEFAKLEEARESSRIEMTHIADTVGQILEIVKRLQLEEKK